LNRCFRRPSSSHEERILRRNLLRASFCENFALAVFSIFSTEPANSRNHTGPILHSIGSSALESSDPARQGSRIPTVGALINQASSNLANLLDLQVRELRTPADALAWWHKACSESHAWRSAISKRNTINNNILVLRHSRSFKKAVDGWFVKKLVTLSNHQQACELCGTRFRKGAVVEHRRSKSTLLVGGTCLKTLQALGFRNGSNSNRRSNAH
jgi:hypothetical protein